MGKRNLHLYHREPLRIFSRKCMAGLALNLGLSLLWALASASVQPDIQQVAVQFFWATVLLGLCGGLGMFAESTGEIFGQGFSEPPRRILFGFTLPFFALLALLAVAFFCTALVGLGHLLHAQ